MNLVALNCATDDYYLASVSMNSKGLYVVNGTFFRRDGDEDSGAEFCFPDRKSAERKCRRLITMKVKRAGYTATEASNAPSGVIVHFKPSLDNMVSPDRMLQMAREARRERYVIFDDIVGIEDRVDAGLEYIGMLDLDDPEYIFICDRNADWFQANMNRFSSVVLTERALEAGEEKREIREDNSVPCFGRHLPTCAPCQVCMVRNPCKQKREAEEAAPKKDPNSKREQKKVARRASNREVKALMRTAGPINGVDPNGFANPGFGA